MARPQSAGLREEVCAIVRTLRRSRGILLIAGLVSGAINILALTGSVYTLELYARVLPARSAPALVALTLAMLALYAASGLLDFLRARLLSRAAERLDRDLSARVFAVQQALALKARRRGDGLQPLRDLDQIRAFLASAGPTAVFDLPFIPLYLGAIFLLHPCLGLLATAGASALIAVMLLAEAASTGPVAATARSAAKRWAFAAAARRNAAAVRAMGLTPHLAQRWTTLNARHLKAQRSASRLANGAGALIKAARPALQSSVLGLGAYLALSGEGAPGVMIAASIIVARALAPVETAIANWRSMTAARQSYARLLVLFATFPNDGDKCTQRATPHQALRVAHLSVAPPGAAAPVVHNVSFALSAGARLGVIGPSASGKSTLAHALVGAWQPQNGTVRLDGTPLTRWAPEALGRHVGYLPQDIALFEGTLADNIARFDQDAPEAEIVAAARAAGVERMIAALPDGYRTQIGEGGAALSAGQRQRIALARALFREPFLVVLDEPNANLDADGERDLAAAIAAVRRRGAIVIVIAHRRALLSGLDQVLMLAGGRVAAFGPRDAVLAEVLQPVATRKIVA